MNRERTTRLPSSRPGFTLVEMLVAVTLVLLMMVMFGEMFQIATGSVTKQRIMADNDQNVRTFLTVLRADLDKRSFRTVVPFFPGELSSNPGTPFDKRGGYFGISNNNIADGTDDVLSFTVDSTVNLRNADETRYFGHAVPLTGLGAGAFLTNSDQPDRDDGQVSINFAGASHAAEVCYWMRGRKLYRRVMLLRDQLDDKAPVQPTNNSGQQFFQPTAAWPSSIYPTLPNTPPNPPVTYNFWTDFDYSAHRLATGFVAAPATGPYAIFNGVKSLDNDTPLISGSPAAESLGQSWNRFGHNHEILSNDSTNGLPREFSAATTPNFFIGRLTQQETSTLTFQYPQTVPGTNPMDATATTFADANNDGVIDTLASGPRIGVDLLLSNVHEFRVEAWDQRIGDFAPIGHSIGAGDYHIGRQLNGTYGPLGGAARIFDTWHPNFDRNFNLPATTYFDAADRPPFRALTWDPTAPTTDPAYPLGPNPNAPFVHGYWAPDTTYNVGDVVFPRTEDLNGNGVLDPGENSTCGFAPPFGDVTYVNFPDESQQLTTLIPNKHPNLQFRPFGLTYAYRCTKQGHSLGSFPTLIPDWRKFEPNWSAKPGFAIRGVDENVIGDQDGDGVLEVEPDWVVDYNVRPLRAIRITVRFEHPQSKQMKQITIVHSLRDNSSVP